MSWPTVAQRLPDPRAQKFVTHTREAILTQEVYQILAGYPDGNDAQAFRHDPLFQTLVGVSPHDDQPLASGSTLNRFHHAYTRRQAELPLEERPVLQEIDAALTQRLKILNDYLPELFIRTRRTPPTFVILDIDPIDDPTHGQQVLSFFHGYYDQHQYFPLFVFDGDTGFPLAAWLRPGTVHASCGAVTTLHHHCPGLAAAWPNVLILVRGDSGLATPEMYEFCEQEGLLYAFGYSSNAVLKERTAAALQDLETYYAFYRHREPTGAALRSDRGLSGRQLVAAAADRGQDRDQPPWHATAALWSRICRATGKASTTAFTCSAATCRRGRSAN